MHTWSVFQNQVTYVTKFDKIGLVCTKRVTKWQGILFIMTQLLHQWANDPCVYHCQTLTCLFFLGFISQACLTCSSAQVAFKWHRCDWTNIHPAGNCHIAGQRTWPVFVISIEFKQAVQFVWMEKSTTLWLPTTLNLPLCNHLWCWCKNYLKCWAIQLAVFCRADPLKEIV